MIDSRSPKKVVGAALLLAITVMAAPTFALVDSRDESMRQGTGLGLAATGTNIILFGGVEAEVALAIEGEDGVEAPGGKAR